MYLKDYVIQAKVEAKHFLKVKYVIFFNLKILTLA